MRVALYSHDSFGLGHLSRCLKLAHAFSAQFANAQGLIVTGSPWSQLFRLPRGFEYWPLLPVTKTGPSAYRARRAGLPFHDALAARSTSIARALRTFRPDLLLVDNVPCGLQGELLPALDRLSPSTRTVLVLRDVLDAPGAIEQQWSAAGAFEAIDAHYDEIWVFGDAASADPFQLSLSGRAGGKVVFCGPIGTSHARPNVRIPPASPRRRPVVLVTGGGGGDAALMIEAYASALRSASVFPESQIVLGPDFPLHASRFDFGGAPAQVTRFCHDLPARLAEADAVVSMAGYNTTCEILDAGVPAVLVPRVWPRQEQWLRARTLAKSGRVQCLPLEGISPRSLWNAVEAALAEKRRPARSSDGGRFAAQQAARLLDIDDVAA